MEGQFGAGRTAEGDPDVTALRPQRVDLRGDLVVAEPGDTAPEGAQLPPEVMKARLNSFTPVFVTVSRRSYEG